ncbi:hypothetical protein ALP44_200095 [Pseudomonas syringae pv. theae]|uniref:Uncharacterized protein n=1 Tax=Pseudomonas syringae pv. theae TaxID=103985 RepID=A0A3M5N0T0_PSESX|nr:hypothetical protein ALP44_200095 [Pseudomonas syringae pv. theae]
MRLKTDDLGGVYADALGLVHFLFYCSPPPVLQSTMAAIIRFSRIAR